MDNSVQKAPLVLHHRLQIDKLRKAKEHSRGKTVLVVERPDSPRPFPLADDFGVLSGLADFATKIAQQVFVKKDALAGVDGDARIARCRGACL